MSTTNRTIRRATWTALPIGLVLVGALTLSPALAQDAASGAATDATAEAPMPDLGRRAGLFFARRGPDGVVAMHGWRGPRDGRAGAPGERREGAGPRPGADGAPPPAELFARWLAAADAAGPLVPGLIGHLAEGTSVHLVFFAGAPEEGGAVLADLTFVAGEGDASAFRDAVRTAAADATHVVVDVLGRVVALPDAAAVDATE